MSALQMPMQYKQQVRRYKNIFAQDMILDIIILYLAFATSLQYNADVSMQRFTSDITLTKVFSKS